MMESEEVLPSGTVSELPLPALLHDVERLYDLGCAAIRNDSLYEAVDCLSKALEMQVQHYGELAPECARTYYKYGCALLYKGQAELDPLGDTGGSKEQVAGSSSAEGSKPTEDEDSEDDADENGEGDGEAAEEGEGDEEEDDLELAWKMLDLARVIYAKQPERTLAEVDVYTALADVSLEKELFHTCFQDYETALLILEGVVEADSRRIAELCFKISLAKQLDQSPREALEYCKRAVSVCEQREERLSKELVKMKAPESESNGLGADIMIKDECAADTVRHGGNAAEIKESISSSEASLKEEIKEIGDLLVDLQEKVEELKQMAAAPSLLEALRATHPEAALVLNQAYTLTVGVSPYANGRSDAPLLRTSASASTTNLPIVSTTNLPVVSATNLPVASTTNLPVVGRGVKRTTPTPVVEELLSAPDVQPAKRTSDDFTNVSSSGEPS